MKVGAIIFDSAHDLLNPVGKSMTPASGWACVAGDAPTRVQSIHDLPQDILWVTNLPVSVLASTGLDRHPNFRSESWLKTPIKQLVTELGADCDTNPVDIGPMVISSVADRVMSASKALYGVEPKSPSLAQDYAKSLIRDHEVQDSDISKITDSIASHLTVSVIRPDVISEPANSIMLRRNRLSHAQEILSTPIPIGGHWQQVNSAVVDGNDSWLEEVDSPFIVKCAIRNMSPATAEVLSWGSGSSSPRQWLTDIEWRTIRKFAEIKIGSAFIYSCPATISAFKGYLPIGHHAALSITNCLIAEQLWSSLMLRRAVHGSDNQFSISAAWLRSSERMIMFEYARRLYGEGIDVMRYGNGNVIVNYRKGELHHVVDTATDMQLMPPCNRFREIPTPGPSHV